MLPLSIGASLALGFVGLTCSVYGCEQLSAGSWPLLVVWGLLAGPAMMLAAQRDARIGRPRRKRR